MAGGSTSAGLLWGSLAVPELLERMKGAWKTASSNPDLSSGAEPPFEKAKYLQMSQEGKKLPTYWEEAYVIPYFSVRFTVRSSTRQCSRGAT